MKTIQKINHVIITTSNQKPKAIFLKTKDSHLKTFRAFTLVELIVVIVILAILATIAFLSFSSQSASARDSTRLSDMNNIAK
jgi:prepilin-type N-terminal cleavage/methylation domain-containing protein